MLSDHQLEFLAACRVARLATADASARPHVVPVCFAIAAGSAYVTLDRKPKRAGARELKRVRNLRENPRAALVVDRWDEDWDRLAWIMLRGRAAVLVGGAEHDRAQDALRERYPQYRAMDIAGLPVIAVRIERVNAWGDLGA